MSCASSEEGREHNVGVEHVWLVGKRSGGDQSGLFLRAVMFPLILYVERTEGLCSSAGHR